MTHNRRPGGRGLRGGHVRAVPRPTGLRALRQKPLRGRGLPGRENPKRPRGTRSTRGGQGLVPENHATSATKQSSRPPGTAETHATRATSATRQSSRRPGSKAVKQATRHGGARDTDLARLQRSSGRLSQDGRVVTPLGVPNAGAVTLRGPRLQRCRKQLTSWWTVHTKHDRSPQLTQHGHEE
jgi:hypothetical protein